MQRLLLVVIPTVLLTAALSALATRYALDRNSPAPGVVEGSLRSAALGEERRYIVHLPESYASEPTKRYPVLYVLDGTSQDGPTADSAALMARIGVTPELIVVGIPNVSGEGRQRDYTPPGMRQDIDKKDSPDGRADRFLAFLKSELMPAIDGAYRTDGRRLLAGHSRGALFVVWTQIADPGLFEARFAHSPALWRDEDALVGQLDEYLAGSPDLHGFLYLSLGDAENEKMTKAFRHAESVLKARAPAGLRWRAEITRGADHQENLRRATPVGLHEYFMNGAVSSAPSVSPAPGT